MSFFLATFPLSIVFFTIYLGVVGFCLFTNLMFTILIIILMLTGCIDISPLFRIADKVFGHLFKDTIARISKNIRESFPVYGNLSYDKQAIYILHPHGTFSLSHTFHIAAKLTDWPRKDIKAVLHSLMLITDLVPKVFNQKFVSSTYSSIREALKEGDSISMCMGGPREALYSKEGGMVAVVNSRKGIFKIALEQGIPIVPVLSYGETENTKGFFNMIYRWCKIYSGVLETKIETHIGKEIEVEKIEEPTEMDIMMLRKKYLEAIQELYKETSPAHYDELEIM